LIFQVVNFPGCILSNGDLFSSEIPLKYTNITPPYQTSNARSSGGDTIHCVDMQRYICICIYIYIFNIASQKPHLHTSQKGFLDYLVPLGFRWFKVDIKESVVKLDESLKAFDTFNE